MHRLIAFDLDGVLYSSEPFLGEAYREAIAAVNARRPGSFSYVPSTREILDHIGWPVRVILERLFPSVDEEAVRLLYDATLDGICVYVRRGAGVLYPDVAATLRGLSAAGGPLAVASNGRERYVSSVLSTYQLTDLFLPLITADQVGDKAVVLRGYLERHAVAPSNAVMIGDRASDVAAARSVGCHFIGCDYGHGYRHEIANAGPVVSQFADLPEVIARVFR